MVDYRHMFNEYLTERGLKLNFVSKKLKINYTSLSNWRTGLRNLSKKHIEKIEIFLKS